MATFLGPVPALYTNNLNVAVNNNPVSGDMRSNNALNCVEVYNGSSWTPLTPGWNKKETLADSVLHAVDTIGMYIEEDHKDNVTINDAYNSWLEATERFCVILAMAEK